MVVNKRNNQTNMATQIDQYRELYAMLETTQLENHLPSAPIWLRIEELLQEIRFTDPLDRVLLPPRLPPASEDDAEVVPDVEDDEETEDEETWRRRVRQRREPEWTLPDVIDLGASDSE